MVKLKNTIYFHNPKTGGLTIRNVLYNDINKKLLDPNISGKVRVQHKYPSELLSKKQWESNFTITSIRHPIDRFISFYNFRTHNSYYRNLHKNADTIGMTFSEYYDYWSRGKEKEKHQMQMPYTRHKTSNKKIDYIVKYENFREDLLNLTKILDVKCEKIPVLNRTKRKKINITDEQLNKLINYFEADFNKFGYDKNIDKIREKYI